ncbi:MAG: protein-L-isoaspartate(D-aspartate) O-methyltransferase [Actinobacteria bacterium]|nr:protein-L-isoaspartate(D-aspartate) O-methyltransferase [Actinomycetota bacterium]
MLNTQIIARNITDNNVITAMKKIPRHLFVETNYLKEAYSDYPLPIGFGQTISQPYIVALMTQELELTKDDKVLEIGTGSGYQTAVLAEITRQVFTIEKITGLIKRAEKILNGLNYKNIHFSNSNGYDGWIEEAPFDKIIVTAAPKEIPKPLLEQLTDGGIMVIPLGFSGWSQTLYKIKKDGKKIIRQEICGVSFVPMVKEET